MNVLLVSKFDIEGGAARAAYRLHQGLRATGSSSHMLVHYKASSDETVLGPSGKAAKLLTKLVSRLDRLPVVRYPARRDILYPSWFPIPVDRQVALINPDLVNLHWISQGFVPIEALPNMQCPIVWTLHDMWALTGGCYYDQECGRYQAQCGACPQLASHNETDLTRRIWQRKYRAWQTLPLTIVTPSRWLATCVQTSSLFRTSRVEVIPYGLDLTLFAPTDRQAARQQIGLPLDKKLILFGAVKSTWDRRKGFHYLQQALQRLGTQGWGQSMEAVVFGAARPEKPPDLGLQTHYVGNIADDKHLTQIYAAADVFVAPSTQDNLPNTILEAMACGTPCVAFAVGGMPDMIEHQHNGYLARPFEVDDLVSGIIWVLGDAQHHQLLAQRVREKTLREYPLELQARRYASLFQDVLERRSV